MKKIISLCLLTILMFADVSAEESTCPADRAANAGHNPFGEFHEIMAPAWHVAWVEKDFDALFAAGPEFEKVFVSIAAMKPELKTDALENKFNENRKKFGDILSAYTQACKAKDKEKVYELMPELHDWFEMTASVLLPIYYPQFDGFVISFNLLYESHLPVNNVEGIEGTTETLVAKVVGLTPETVPSELEELKPQMMIDISVLKDLVMQIKDCCDKKEYNKVQVPADELAKRIEKFVTDYI